MFLLFVCVALQGQKSMKKQHLRIQEGHFLKSALNLDLTLSDDGKCPALLKSSGITDLGAKNFGANVRYCVFLDIMKIKCSYIVSFVVKSPSRGKNP